MSNRVRAQDLRKDSFQTSPARSVSTYALLLSYMLSGNQTNVSKVFATDFTTPPERFSIVSYRNRFTINSCEISEDEVFFVEAYNDNGMKKLLNSLISASSCKIPPPTLNAYDALKYELVICEIQATGKRYNDIIDLQKAQFNVLGENDCISRIKTRDKYFIEFIQRIEKRVDESERGNLEKRIGFSKLLQMLSRLKRRTVEVSGSDLLSSRPSQSHNGSYSSQTNSSNNPSLTPQKRPRNDEFADAVVRKRAITLGPVISSEDEDTGDEFEFHDASDNFIDNNNTKRQNKEYINSHETERLRRELQNQLSSEERHYSQPIQETSYMQVASSNLNSRSNTFTSKTSFNKIVKSKLDGNYNVSLRFIGFEPYGSELPVDSSNSYKISPSIKLYFTDGLSDPDKSISGLITEYLVLEFDNYKPLLRLFGIRSLESAIYGERGGLTDRMKNFSLRHTSSYIVITNTGTKKFPKWTVLEENANPLI